MLNRFVNVLMLTTVALPAFSQAQSGQNCVQEMIAVGDLYSIDFAKTKTVVDYCQGLRAQGFCAVNCEDRLRDKFGEAKGEADRKLAEKQAVIASESALKSGSAEPVGIKEAAISYSAQPGGALASAPKIKPDGGMYYMHGKIKMAGEEPQFLAALSSSKENELLAGALRKSRGMGESTDYFAVTIPKSLQKYYFDNAKIDGGFDVVGRYVSNTKYKTVAGQEKAAPVFEAVYFVAW
jgi:hypothetical protein